MTTSRKPAALNRRSPASGLLESRIVAWIEKHMTEGTTVTFKECPNGITQEVEVYAGGDLVGVGATVKDAMLQAL
jgi:hypothetical protein